MATVTQDGQLSTVWHVRKGATFHKPYTWMTGSVDNPQAVSLVGWTAVCRFKEKLDSPTPFLTLTSDAGHIVLDDQGHIDITFPADLSATVIPMRGVFNLKLTQTATGFVRNLVGGTVMFYPEV